ncbi:poly-beta-1,6 N-acetyl-D-glucosamine synthase/poly-beta-1,6-N-acetyl-D-glucosamine biosynthesis protein PgaD,TIGR03940 [Oscillospiraceae bacterium]|nr:poly-beta-1,6 N-acetyl-D-glucosamine synthase/poly-beta-1,6-N-acetyl-D-glucosamine biosynthesis protein PgaD,TIGR03940 [Oscillospiraceae bacterium]
MPLRIMEQFVFWYPAVMAMLWVFGALLFYFSNERKGALPLEKMPFVSILMPAHNESSILYPVIEQMVELNYPNYEIIIINDGSSDDTAEVIRNLTARYPIVRGIDLKPNCGKANALYLGLIASKGEILVGVDADSYLDKNAIRYLVSHFVNENNGERVGAVTGNPRVRNRGSLLGKLQLCEYASIISLIKRTQRVLGKVMTVSGVCVAYRKRALLDCGFWDRDMMTEDIAVTWKLEKKFWDVRYEPRALCWMLVPETVKGLWRQRKRWSEGGLEVIFRHWDIFKSWRRRRMTPIYFEQVLSFMWSVCWLIFTIILICMEIAGKTVFTDYIWKSQFLSFICLFQFIVAMFLESKYDRDVLKNAWSVIWYPLFYWYINVFIALAAVVRAILPNKKLATWKSPDRGITQLAKEAQIAENGGTDEIPEEVPDANENKELTEEELRILRLQQAASGLTVGDNEGLIDPSFSIPLIDGSEDRPAIDYKIERHIEYENKQVLWKRVIEVILTVISWIYIVVYWLFMVQGMFLDYIGRPVKEFWVYTIDSIHQTEEYFSIMSIVILLEVLLLILWKEYNYRLYGKRKRRHFKPDVTAEELDRIFELDEEMSRKLHNDKFIVVPVNPIPEGMGQGRKKKKK